MKTLYKHVHLVIDDKREYLDGSILINNGVIEDVFIQSNKIIDDAKELDMNGKIFIPMFFDTKSKLEKQKGVINRFVCSEKVLEEPTHLVSDESIKTLKNVCAVTRIKNYQKVNGVKTFINPSSIENIFADAVSDITKEKVLDFNKNKMINYAFQNKCFVEFGIDNSINDDYISFVFKNIDVDKILLISFDHDDILDQIKRLHKLNISLTDIVAMTSINPNAFYGNTKQEGYLIKGKSADIICLDDNLNLDFVLVKGEKYD